MKRCFAPLLRQVGTAAGASLDAQQCFSTGYQAVFGELHAGKWVAAQRKAVLGHQLGVAQLAICVVHLAAGCQGACGDDLHRQPCPRELGSAV